MVLIRALILGIAQGAASVFPVSSSGHVGLLSRVTGASSGAPLPVMALFHLGTLIAVAFLFYRDIVRLGLAAAGIFQDLFFNLRILFSGKKKRAGKTYRRVLDGGYRRFALMICVSLVPTFVIGRLLAGLAMRGGNHLLATAVGFFVTALLLLVSSFFGAAEKGPSRAGIIDALLVGIFQGAAVFPGISRLGMVLASSNLCGLSRKFTVKYAFLMSIPTTLGALTVEMRGAGGMIAQAVGIPGAVLGVAVSALTALSLLHIAVRVLKHRPDRAFALYNAAIGTVSVIVYIAQKR